MKKPVAPCKGCPDRVPEPNCHITCLKYKEFVKQSEIYREEKYQAIEANRIQTDIENRRKKMAATGQMYRKKKRHGNS